MDEFNSLIDIIERLVAPDGCPWDLKQTLQSMRHSLMEETYEVIEAIDCDNNRQIEEELGDLLFNVVFLCKLAEKEKRFKTEDVLRHIVEKLIRRHPHIFGDEHLTTSEEVLKQWESIKQTEKKDPAIHSMLDGIPKRLPALARAQKITQKLTAKQYFPETAIDSLSKEEQAGQALWESVQQMNNQDIQAEQALLKRLAKIEAEFRAWEKKKN
jgi:tetrapyrrole methylase family protein / MazG family protein